MIETDMPLPMFYKVKCILHMQNVLGHGSKPIVAKTNLYIYETNCFSKRIPVSKLNASYQNFQVTKGPHSVNFSTPPQIHLAGNERIIDKQILKTW
jgi:hypothetical protein